MTRTDNTSQAAAHSPETWTYNPSAIVQDAEGNIIADCELVPECERCTPTPAQEVANARRIVAAVNACQGLSTEALERGVVPALRHALGAVLDGAAELDAALDGTTEEFDAERARLNAACQNAGTALGAGTEIDLHGLLASRGQIALVWSVEDVQEVRPDLADQQARKVLQQVERWHDATIGVTWETLELIAEDLFGNAPEASNAEEAQP